MVIIPDFTADTRQREKNTGKRKENVRSTTVYTKKRFYKSKNNKIKKQEKYQKYIDRKKNLCYPIQVWKQRRVSALTLAQEWLWLILKWKE